MALIETHQLTLFERSMVRLLRMIPARMRGKNRIARMLLRGGRCEKGAEIETSFGTFVVPSLQEPLAFSLLVDGEYEPDTLKLILGSLAHKGTFLDVGANIGMFSLGIARKRPDSSIVAFEASPKVFPFLSRNLQRVPQVQCVHCAVADREKEIVKFYEAPDSSFGMGSMAPQFSNASVDVETRMLDELVPSLSLNPVSVIKADVEGFELQAFKGGEQLLRRDRPTVIFEFIDWAESRAGFMPGAAQQFLLDLGYSLAVYERCERPIVTPIRKGGAMIVARYRS